ncbi:MAG TPA: methyltransferase [Gammaproteobacteria bacterium]|nr:methyltransferase [Gammaproteobacteria bacterium]
MPVKSFSALIPLTVLLLVCTVVISAENVENNRAVIQKVLGGHHRNDADKLRDRYRHPVETLDFFEFKQHLTVVEIWPGLGWYTDILAPALKSHGVLYTAHFDPNSNIEFYRKYAKKFHQKIASDPENFSETRITILQPPEYMEIAPPGSADLVLTFRNVHNWMLAEKTHLFFQAMYRALKPGGILGIVEHRANPSAPHDPLAKSGYVHEQQVIQFAKQAGFQFVARSAINSNPKDEKNYAEGVWSLPPTLREGEKDRQKYLNIGESDRMTLKFRKPG